MSGSAHTGADAGADGHEHAHGVGPDTDRRYLAGALALILAFMAAEVVIGLLARSLVLISDAGHMLTDAAAIVLALVAMRVAARPPRGGYTYGLRRVEILSALANGVTLLVLAVWVTYEGVRRLLDPPDVAGPWVLGTALVGIGVNVAATWLMSRANRSSLNVEGAFQHILNDLYAFLATAAAGLVMTLTGFTRADALASFVVVALMIRAGVHLVRASARVFLEAAPAGLVPDRVGGAMAKQPGVAEVHDLHIWEITSGIPAASAHVLVERGHDCHIVGAGLQRLLADQYGVAHTTLQVDHRPDDAAAADGHCTASHGPRHQSELRR